MRIYTMIAVGGFFGATLRFSIKTLEISQLSVNFPLSTLLINILGCLILGFFVAIVEDKLKLGEAEKLGVVSGFLGALTTFSSISKEISLQLALGDILTAGLYLGLSIILGLGAIFAGLSIGSKFVLYKPKTD
ncbi:MAG: hypothetical protein A2Y23_07260 [Clostridiales bacterium GWB2_37_7]|nr:MAG: hypothetical protein A2Y23_07260 [Clostridiales bacterium GWB2_37_7]